jgi:DNA-binding beta-propeller fold protein YncE
VELDRRSLLRLAAGGAIAPLLASPARRPPSRPGARGGGGRALVTADLDGFVAVVDLERRRVVRRLATRDGPRSLESRAGAGAIVGHAALGVVTLLHAAPALGVRRVLRGFGEPRYAAIAPGGGHAFVTDSGHGELAVIDLRAGRVVRRVEVGAGARHLTLDPRGRTLWIALGSTAAELVVVDVGDPLAPRVVRHLAPPFGAHDVAFSPTGRRVWVTAGRTPRVALYDAGAARASRPPHTIPAGAAPQHVTFGPHAAYVASGEGRSLTVHALDDGRPRHRAVTPLGSYNVARGAGRVLTPSLHSGELTVLDAAGRVRWAVTIGAAAHDVCAV